MAEAFQPQVRHNKKTGIVTIGLGRETALIQLAQTDAVEFACSILEHAEAEDIYIRFKDGGVHDCKPAECKADHGKDRPDAEAEKRHAR